MSNGAKPSIVPVSCGFSTANGKSVTVSAEALKKIKSLWDDLDDEFPIDSSIGFSTANGKSVTVSKESLKKVKSFWSDDFSTDNNPVGFSTVNTNFSTAKESFSTANENFSTENANSSPAKGNFSTGNGKPETVSEETPHNINDFWDDDDIVFPIDDIIGDVEAGVSPQTIRSPDISTQEVLEISKAILADEEEAGDSFATECPTPQSHNSNDNAQEEEAAIVEAAEEQVEAVEEPAGPTSFAKICPGEEITIRATVARCYPAIVGCNTPDGRFNYYSRAAFEKLRCVNEAKRQGAREELYLQVEAELAKLKPKGPRRPLRSSEMEKMNTDELLQVVENSDVEDLCELHASLSNHKLKELQEARQRSCDEHRRKTEDEVNARMNKLNIMDDVGAVQIFRVRLLDATAQSKELSDDDDDELTNPYNAILSLYRPYDYLYQVLVEGRAAEIRSVKSSSVQSSDREIKMYSTRNTVASPLTYSNELPVQLQRQCYSFEEILGGCFNPPFGEFDTVGLIVHINHNAANTGTGEIVYLADEDENIFSIKFWKLIADEGVDNIIKVGNFISLTNVQWRQTSADKYEVPVGYVQETTCLSLSPKEHLMKENLQALKSIIGHANEHVLACERKVHEILNRREFPLAKTPPLKRRIQPIHKPGSAKKILLDDFNNK